MLFTFSLIFHRRREIPLRPYRVMETIGGYCPPPGFGLKVSDIASGKKGFTLLELMVTIALIAILISLLFPALSSVREKAKSASCMSNLRQLGVALTSYLADTKGIYPGHHTMSGTIVWPHRLRPYVGNNHDVFHCPSLGVDAKWPVTWSSTEPHNNPNLAKYGYYAGEIEFRPTTYVFSYGYNDWGTGPGGLGASADDPNSPLPRLATIANPSQMYAMGDTTADGVWDTAIDPDNPTEAPSRRHNGGSNILFVDGHVENVNYEDLVSREDEWRSRWNRTGRPN